MRRAQAMGATEGGTPTLNPLGLERQVPVRTRGTLPIGPKLGGVLFVLYRSRQLVAARQLEGCGLPWGTCDSLASPPFASERGIHFLPAACAAEDSGIILHGES